MCLYEKCRLVIRGQIRLKKRRSDPIFSSKAGNASVVCLVLRMSISVVMVTDVRASEFNSLTVNLIGIELQDDGRTKVNGYSRRQKITQEDTSRNFDVLAGIAINSYLYNIINLSRCLQGCRIVLIEE